MVYSTRRFVVCLSVCHFVLVFFLLVLRLPRLGKRELILVLFVRLFGSCLFRFLGFRILLGSGKGCGLWLWHSLDFSLTFLAHLSQRLKVSYCDHSPSVVVVVRLSVRPFTIFKQHLLLNHWWDFDQISQEWSLVDPLLKLYKWFRSIAYLGHRS